MLPRERSSLILALSLLIACSALTLIGVGGAHSADKDDHGAFLDSIAMVANPSTVPSNGDVNPYGVAFVPADRGMLKKGNILVSNFNNNSNLQGTGTTIVQIDSQGALSLFFQGSNLGLTTALGVLPDDVVAVGNVPTTDGTSNTVMQGSLLLIDSSGTMIDNLTSATLLDGPWDLAVHNRGHKSSIFVSNVLSGTVTRIDLTVKKGKPTVGAMTQIASGYTHRTDPAALVIGPTGLVFDENKHVLYVASTGDNEIFSIANPETTKTDNGMGTLVYSDPAHLHGPLGMVMAPNGDLLATQGDAVNPDPAHNSEIVEFTPAGHFVTELQVDPAAGAAFGMAISKGPHGVKFAAVDDGTNTLEIFKDADKN